MSSDRLGQVALPLVIQYRPKEEIDYHVTLRNVSTQYYFVVEEGEVIRICASISRATSFHFVGEGVDIVNLSLTGFVSSASEKMREEVGERTAGEGDLGSFIDLKETELFEV